MVSRLVAGLLVAALVGGVVYRALQDKGLDERLAAATVHAFHERLLEGNGEAACALLTGHALADWSDRSGGCAGTARDTAAIATAAQRQAARTLEIVRVRIDGDRGAIHEEDVEFAPGLEHERAADARPTILVRRNGRWLISDLG